MLFQPTNIYPDQKGTLGNGTIDATKALPVSWQVNGNSDMTSFSITIYRNNAASTQLYTTGQITSGCPFSPSDRNGNPKMFSYTISASALSSAGVANGGSYKLVIKQWYNGGNITQTSASAFITRATPVLSLSVPSVVTSKEISLTASYSQSQSDPVNWVKWTLVTTSDYDNPIYETPEMNTSVLEMQYDGLFSGTEYAVKCRVETSNGVIADTGWKVFTANYVTESLTGVAKTSCGKHGAVSLEWSGIAYIFGTGSGYEIVRNIIRIGAAGSVMWNEKNGKPMAFSSPWTAIWKGKMVRDGYSVLNSDILNLQTSAGQISIKCEENIEQDGDGLGTGPAHSINLYRNGTLEVSLPGPDTDVDCYIILSPTILYVRVERFGIINALYPDLDLYPSDELYPDDGEKYADFFYHEIELPFSQGSLQSIELGKNQYCSYLQIVDGNPTKELLNFAYNDGGYVPVYDENTLFLADFTDDLRAGNTSLRENITGYTIYRKKGDDGKLYHVVDVGDEQTQIYDFSLESRQGPYIYYMFPTGTQTYMTNPVISKPITACLKSWYLLSCRQDEADEKLFWVNKAFAFGKNLDTGTVTNSNRPNILSNFTRYPTVQKSNQQYQSGTLSSLIGIIGYDDDGKWTYWNTKSMRDAVWALSTTNDTLFLRSMLGDFLRVEISGEIGMRTILDSKLSVTADVPWVEVEDTDGMFAISLSLDGIENT